MVLEGVIALLAWNVMSIVDISDGVALMSVRSFTMIVPAYELLVAETAVPFSWIIEIATVVAKAA